jgi:hypothetical protein
MVVGGCAFLESELNTGLDSDQEPRLGLREYEPIIGESGYETLDEAYAWMARIVPGFGGIFFDESDVLNVYLVDPNTAQKALLILESLFVDRWGDEIIPPASTWKVLQGRYDFVQLNEWHNKLIHFISNSNVTMSDIDERHNRLTIGVKELKPVVQNQQVVREIEELGIPLEAIAFKEYQGSELTGSLRDDLRGEQRPVIGGVISDDCTLGLVVNRSGTPGFIINAHCTPRPGALENPRAPIYQPYGYLTKYLIGHETLDPQGFIGTGRRHPNGPEWTCRRGERCRWSDSAFVTRRSGVASSQGIIAKPDRLSMPGNISFKIAGSWSIVALMAGPPDGTRINKVGAKTGWTEGRVDGTCTREYSLGNTNIQLLCQYRADYYLEHGDSGAPVFIIRSSNPSTVALVGLHWGKERIGTQAAIFSPMRDGVMRDLGMGGGICIPGVC